MSTAAILARMGASLNALGVSIAPGDVATERTTKALSPTVPTTTDLRGAEFMNQPQVESLVDLTVSQNAWLSAVSVKMRDQRAGTIPRMVLNDVVTEGVGENGGGTVSTVPDTDEINYQCAKYQSTWFLTLEDVGEARGHGEADFDGKVRRAFAKAMGNDMARAGLAGDTSLNSASRLNRLLRQRDGWLKKARASGRYGTTTRGTRWSRTIYPAMLRQLPTQFKDDPELRWMLPPMMDEDFTFGLQNLGDGALLRDEALTSRKRYSPMGIAPILVPQWPTAQGFETLSGSPADADSVANDGDGTLTATVNTLFGGYNAAHAGRTVRITYDLTGQSEDLTVVDTGSNLVIRSAGSLGQSSISTTPSAYTLDLADCTGAMLTNPRNLFMVMARQIRAYRKFEQESERWRVDVFYEADFGIFNPDALVLQEGVVPSAITFGS
jgi:hypothetical protein